MKMTNLLLRPFIDRREWQTSLRMRRSMLKQLSIRTLLLKKNLFMEIVLTVKMRMLVHQLIPQPVHKLLRAQLQIHQLMLLGPPTLQQLLLLPLPRRKELRKTTQSVPAPDGVETHGLKHQSQLLITKESAITLPRVHG